MSLKTRPAATLGGRCGFVFAWFLVFAFPVFAFALTSAAIGPHMQNTAGRSAGRGRAQQNPPISGAQSLSQWVGLPVRRISVEGVDMERIRTVMDRLALSVDAPLTQEKLQESLRQIYATGLFDSIQVEGARDAAGVDIDFRGQPRIFIGTVIVDGAKGATVNTQLERASQLAAGARFTQAKLARALEQMRATLADDGFNEPKITPELMPRPQ